MSIFYRKLVLYPFLVMANLFTPVILAITFNAFNTSGKLDSPVLWSISSCFFLFGCWLSYMSYKMFKMRNQAVLELSDDHFYFPLQCNQPIKWESVESLALKKIGRYKIIAVKLTDNSGLKSKHGFINKLFNPMSLGDVEIMLGLLHSHSPKLVFNKMASLKACNS